MSHEEDLLDFKHKIQKKHFYPQRTELLTFLLLDVK